MFKNILVMLLVIIGSNHAWAESKTTFYHYDLLGSPVATTDESGNVLWREEYSPWGEKLLKEDASHDNVRDYTGHVHDKETGLTYMQARYYDPQIGRFMGIDPVGFKESNPIMFNRYAYANNNPFKFVDPNGEYSEKTIRSNGNININIPIDFIGPAATQENIDKIKDNVSSVLSGKYTINNKETYVSVKVTAKPALSTKINTISLLNGPTSEKTVCNGCSFVNKVGGTKGEWNVSKPGFFANNVPAHEVPHLGWANDHYKSSMKDGIRTTTPDKKFRGTLMGEIGPDMRPNDDSMQEMVDGADETKEE